MWHKHHRGKKPLVVFLHGWCMNHTAMNPFEEIARELGHSTLVVDLPGHGKSNEMEGSIDAALAKLNEIIDEPPIIFGYSIGSRLALMYAQEHETRGLFLTSTHWETQAKATTKNPLLLWAFFKEVAKYSFDKEHGQNMRQFLRKVLFAYKQPDPTILDDSYYDFAITDKLHDIELFYEGMIRSSLASIYNLPPGPKAQARGCSQVTNIPLRLICGEYDPITSIQSNQRLAEIMGRRLEVLEGVGHLSVVQGKGEIGDIFKKWIEEFSNYLVIKNKKFKLGDRIVVSEHQLWPQQMTGVIKNPHKICG